MYERVVLKLAYDGTSFSGWQKQPEERGPTVQGELERALSRLLDSAVRTIGSGRTDAGVHAHCQYVHFDAPRDLSGYRLVKSLNSILPESIVVRSAWRAPSNFHALASARGKTYRYRIHNFAIPNPFRRNTCLFERRPLNIDWLNLASRHLVGELDFKSFQSQGTPVASTIRTIDFAQWSRREKNLVEFRVHGTGFLKQMVRNIVGTLLNLHHRGSPTDEILSILSALDRRAALTTAPGHGLCLVGVDYPTALLDQLVPLL